MCNEVTLTINGRANQKAFCGIISVPLFSNLNLSVIAPTIKYVTNTTMALCVDRVNIYRYTHNPHNCLHRYQYKTNSSGIIAARSTWHIRRLTSTRTSTNRIYIKILTPERKKERVDWNSHKEYIVIN